MTDPYATPSSPTAGSTTTAPGTAGGTLGTTGTAGPTGATGTTGTTSGPTGASGTSTTDAAKDQARNLKEQTAAAGEHLLDEARSEASAVAQEAQQRVGDLWSQARTEVSGQVGGQQNRLAGGLRSFGDQLHQMADAPAEQSVASDVVREVASRVGTLGRWLEDHEPDEVLDEVRRFARRRPGTFLLAAAAAGVVVGRLTRGLKDAGPATQSTDHRRQPAGSSTNGSGWAAPSPVTSAAPSGTGASVGSSSGLPSSVSSGTSTATREGFADPVGERPTFTTDPGASVPGQGGWADR
ncbi:hypothetical protein [Cellulomonas sp. URHB0016]